MEDNLQLVLYTGKNPATPPQVTPPREAKRKTATTTSTSTSTTDKPSRAAFAADLCHGVDFDEFSRQEQQNLANKRARAPAAGVNRGRPQLPVARANLGPNLPPADGNRGHQLPAAGSGNSGSQLKCWNSLSYPSQEHVCSANQLIAFIESRGIASLAPNARVVEEEDSVVQPAEFAAMSAVQDAMSVFGDKIAGSSVNGFNEIVEKGLGEILRRQKVFSVPPLTEFIDLDGQNMHTIRKKNYSDLIFTAVPYVDMGNGQYVSPNRNMAKESEFLDPPFNTILNPTFWSHQSSCLNTRDSDGKFWVIELAALTPKGLLRDDQIPQHEAAIRLNRQFGSGLDDASLGFFKLSLYRTYQSLFVQNMNSPIVQAARKAGWRPLFRMKNAQNQQGSYGAKHPQITSRDQPPKSFLHLIGFIRCGDTVNDVEHIIGISSASGNIIAIPER